MVAIRKTDAGFTLTELMVVVVILSILAALSSPLFTRDNNARRGRGWANTVAQLLQRARFQAMGDRANIHVRLYRARVEMHREETDGSLTLLSSTPGPVADVAGDKTVAIWDVQTSTHVSCANLGVPTDQLGPTSFKEITFTPLGGTTGTANSRVSFRNELLPSGHPDASFGVCVRWLTGFICSVEMVTL